MARSNSLAILMPLLLACSPADVPAASDAGPALRPEGEDQELSAFDAEHIYFGAENRRKVQVEVAFPGPQATYSSVIGHFRLHCPNNLCDHWDRYGSLRLVENPGTEDARAIEIDRFITPYQVGFSWQSDLTDLRPLLTGRQTLEVFIDTWVGPGHDQGEGWLFDARFEFVGGAPPDPEPDQVIPVWPHLSYQAGRPGNLVADQVIPVSLPIVGDPYEVKLRSFITGHGFGGAQNCAEFCSKRHEFSVNGDAFERNIWRTDCGSTETDGAQLGTWRYARAGWCPGAQVRPWESFISRSWVGETVEISYDLEPYTWAGNGGEPFYYLSALVITYR